MADQKITELTALTTVADGDVIAIVDDPSGSPITKKITKANLVKDIPLTNGGTGGTSATTAMNNIAPTTTRGDIIYHAGTNNARLAVGTNLQVLASNGTDPVWTSGYLKHVIDDTTPTLGGDLVGGDNNISGLGSVGFTQELDNGSKTASFTVDFITDQKQKAALTANTMTLTLDTTDVNVGNYVLKLVNGGLATLTWASETGSIFWPGGTAPTLTASGTDIVSLYFDGTNWYGQAGVDFQ